MVKIIFHACYSVCYKLLKIYNYNPLFIVPCVCLALNGCCYPVLYYVVTIYVHHASNCTGAVGCRVCRDTHMELHFRFNPISPHKLSSLCTILRYTSRSLSLSLSFLSFFRCTPSLRSQPHTKCTFPITAPQQEYLRY